MSLTTDMKDELARVKPATAGEMTAELATMLRLSGGLHLVAGHILIESELDSQLCAFRLRTFLGHLYGAQSSVVVVSGGGIRRGDRFVVRVVKNADAIARRTALVDSAGRPVRGLPSQLISSGTQACRAAWRGAFLARGSLMEPGRSTSMEITCPGAEVAMALVGCARRMGASAKQKEVRGQDRVTVKDSDSIGTLITQMGAVKTFATWQERRVRREARGSANRLANFDDANLRRSAQAAVTAGIRVQRAFDILGDQVPEHLREAGELRIKFKHASLEELGKHVDPPLTKDAVAGRIRRLLAMADKAAHDRGLPDTEATLHDQLLEEE